MSDIFYGGDTESRARIPNIKGCGGDGWVPESEFARAGNGCAEREGGELK